MKFKVIGSFPVHFPLTEPDVKLFNMAIKLTKMDELGRRHVSELEDMLCRHVKERYGEEALEENYRKNTEGANWTAHVLMGENGAYYIRLTEGRTK